MKPEILEEITRAQTISIPGGAVLTDAEWDLRRGRISPRPGVAIRLARSILAKVASAISGEGK